MILVDSSVWIDFFHGTDSHATDFLDKTLGTEPIAIGDLMLAEVLQGFRSRAEMLRARRSLLELSVVEIVGRERALLAAENYRMLRDNGITIPKTIDTLIATFCIQQRIPLLFSDRDFDPFVEHLGLVPALAG
jgi:predicted nucleic acid-binding protein